MQKKTGIYMDWIVSILLWGAGFLGLFFLTMDTRSSTSKNDQSIVVTVISILLLVLIGSGVYSLSVGEPSTTPIERSTVDLKEVGAPVKASAQPVTTSDNSEVFLWLFYALFFFSFFAWLFSPSNESESAKEILQKKLRATVMLDQLQKPFTVSPSDNDMPAEPKSETESK
jgi:hypothetical protein